LMLIFLQKSKLLLINSSSCTNMLFVDGQSAPMMANFITSYRVISSMFLWSLPLAVQRMVSV
jgi:hypothetical protein